MSGRTAKKTEPGGRNSTLDKRLLLVHSMPRVNRYKAEHLRSEIAAHIEEKALELIETGMPEQEAWQRARWEFGNVTAINETSREVWGWMWLERLWQDAVYARRILTKHAGFTAIAVLSLALGVGANCAMFSLADTLLLRPLPVPRPGEVLNVGSTAIKGTANGLNMSYPDYRDLRDRSRSFRELTAFDITPVRFARQAGALTELRAAAVVTGNFFSVMEVQPELGRTFRADEDQVPGRDAVLVLSHAFWEREFRSDPSAVGQRVRLDGIDYTIIGVLAEKFTGPDPFVRPEFYLPTMMLPRLAGATQNPLENRGARPFDVRGRLRAGSTLAQAQAEAAVIGKTLATEYSDTNSDYRIEVRTELQERTAEAGPVAMLVAMLMLLSGAVLLVACANVAGLLTSRAPARAREMAVRLAIGAGRGRLIRQLLTESLLLALAGAIGGIGVGYAGVQLMKQLTVLADVPVAVSFLLDERALLFSLMVAIGSVLIFGLGPAMRAARADLRAPSLSIMDTLRVGGSQDARPRMWTRNVLVAGQVAMSMVLLTVAALMYQTFRNTLLAGPGFRTDHLLVAGFDPSLVNYTDAQTKKLYKDLRDRAGALPGVRSAALSSVLPASYSADMMAIVPERYQMPEGQKTIQILASRVDENYFATFGVPILRGRGFTEDDDSDSPLVAVLNETAAGIFWPGEDAIGKRVRLGGDTGPALEIVGVVKTGKYQFLMERPRNFLYVPYAQHPRSRMNLLLESAGDPASLTAPLSEVVRGLDSNLPVYSVRTFQQTFETGAVTPNLMIIELEAAMGGMGVLLALSGLYGLMAYSVSARRREIGIRMAIGAHKNQVLAMVLRQGLLLAGTGTAVGLIFSAGVGRLLVAAFPATQNSVVAYLIVVPAVFAVTMLAAFLPARRASQVDPVTALRQD